MATGICMHQADLVHSSSVLRGKVYYLEADAYMKDPDDPTYLGIALARCLRCKAIGYLTKKHLCGEPVICGADNCSAQHRIVIKDTNGAPMIVLRKPH
jgi:hypothetical protein